MTEGQIASYNQPYGDIVFVQSPQFDSAINRLYDEQHQREMYRQRESFALDEMVQKEFGKIRSVDTPEVIQNYQRYKEIKKKLLFDKRAQRDPQLYNAMQREASLALQDVYKGINRSQELLEGAKMDDQARNRNPSLYDDNYGEKRALFWNTPMSKLAETEHGDLANPDTYRYKGSNTDFQKLLTAAMGTPKQAFALEEPVDKSGLQTKITPYTFGNTPAQVKESLLGAMGMHRSGRDAEYLWDTLPQQEIENTIAQYKSIPQDKWQKMGLPGPQDLTPRNPNSKAENYASYMAMKYAINNEPKQGTAQYRNNKDAQRQAALDDWMTKEGVKQANRQQLIEIRRTNKQMDKAQEGIWVGRMIEEMMTEAKSGTKARTKLQDGTIREEAQIPIDAMSAKALSRGSGSTYVEPDYIRVTADGKIRPVFYKYKDGKPVKNKDGWYELDEMLSQPISTEVFKQNLSKHVQSAKQRGAEMNDGKGGSGGGSKTSVDDIKAKFGIQY